MFPQTYEQTLGQWREGAILLVAGRVDHRGEEASLLADAVWDWDAVGGARRRRRSRARSGRSTGGAAGVAAGRAAANGSGYANGNGSGGDGGRREAVAVGPGMGAAAPSGGVAASPVRVSPTRAVDDDLPQIAPAEPIATYAEPPDLASASLAGGTDGAPRSRRSPTRQRNVAAAAAQAPQRAGRRLARRRAQRPVRAGRRLRTASSSAMQAFKAVLRERPGGTRVVVHVPAPGGSALPMELRGVAYDAELLAEVRRRVGDGVIDISLASLATPAPRNSNDGCRNDRQPSVVVRRGADACR